MSPTLRLVLAVFLPWGGGMVATERPAAEVAAAAIQPLMDRAGIPGLSVAVVHRERLIWAQGFGLAVVDRRIPVTPEVRFGLGSLTKPLTTALIARLVEQGILEWDAPVERYLPDFPMRGRGVTLRRIAAHQAGLGDEFDRAHAQTTRRFDRARDVVPLLCAQPLQAEPGARAAYNTGSFTLLAAVVEAATGHSFMEAMRQEVLEPLGLAGIQPNDRAQPDPGRSEFYSSGEDGRPVAAPFVDFSHKWAGAGYQASAVDIARFASALHEGRLLRPASVAELFTAQSTNDGRPTPYGLGWVVGAPARFGMRWVIGPDEFPRRIVHHPGGGHGISCWLVLDLETGLVVCLLSNLSGAPVGGRVFDVIFEAFLAEVNTDPRP